ncbi:hypothetical protein FACS189454_06310 [Planctomycetales bacterium]|nr:hypothetical protein FACS189454_06310 [Planctomycetales bacterium]
MSRKNSSRRGFLKTLSVAGTALAASSFGKANAATDNNLPRFAVISDIHCGCNRRPLVKIPRALKNLQRTGHLDAVFVIGDLTDNGRVKQYDQLLSIFKDKSVIPETLPVYFMMGNHEYYNEEEPVENFTRKIGQPQNQFIDIKGYPFITLSCEGSGADDYKENAQKFLEDHLARANSECPGKPIFVFFHFPPKNTSYGSYGSVHSRPQGTSVLLPYLEKYPQVVVFSGHTHIPVGDPRMIFQDKFTSINDGSTSNAWVALGKDESIWENPDRHLEVTEGLIVNVLPGTKLNVERWDTYRNVPYVPWEVDWKNKNYKGQTNSEAPKFEFGVKPKVQITGSGCLVTYPQAKDDDIVFRYIVEIKDGGETVASYKQSSQFYLTTQMPETLTAEFDKLPSGKKLTASVKALDSFNNESDAIVSIPFSV